MFGGIGFMLNGNLVAGASPRGLLVRVGKDRQAEALAWPATPPGSTAPTVGAASPAIHTSTVCVTEGGSPPASCTYP